MSPTTPDAQRQGLSARGLGKTYAFESGPLRILEGIDLDIAAGESVAIVGPSGSGKSTLLHILGTLDRPTAGTLEIAGVKPFDLSEKKLAGFRNEKMGFVFQDHYLLPQCTLLENVLIPTLPKVGATEEMKRLALGLLDRVGLANRANHRPVEISGGERQRAAIARALLRSPALILCDEPTGNLDRTNAAAIADLLIEVHRATHAILVVVTHSAELAARLDRRFELNDGKLVE